MMGRTIAELLKEESAEFGKVKPAKQKDHAVIPMIDKIIGKCKADIKAIERLDEDQKKYLERDAKAFLVLRRNKIKKHHK